jgi:hypothetical protein
MRSGISLREDFDGERLRRLARQTKDAAQVRSLLALASIYDGGTRSDAVRLGNVTLQIVRDWVMLFNERGPAGLVNGKAHGKQLRLNDQQRAALAQSIERGPTPYLVGVVRRTRTPSSSWIRQAGRCPTISWFLQTSPSYRSRRNHLSLTPSKTSGNSCAKIGSQTVSSNPTTTSSITAAMLGERSKS